MNSDGVLVLMVLPQLGGLQLSCDQLELHGGAQRYRALPHAARHVPEANGRTRPGASGRPPLAHRSACTCHAHQSRSGCTPTAPPRASHPTPFSAALTIVVDLFSGQAPQNLPHAAHTVWFTVQKLVSNGHWVKRIAPLESCPSCWFWQSEVAIQNQVDRS